MIINFQNNKLKFHYSSKFLSSSSSTLQSLNSAPISFNIFQYEWFSEYDLSLFLSEFLFDNAKLLTSWYSSLFELRMIEFVLLMGVKLPGFLLDFFEWDEDLNRLYLKEFMKSFLLWIKVTISSNFCAKKSSL